MAPKQVALVQDSFAKFAPTSAGEAMAELIVDGIAHTVDLTPFNPGRMSPFDPALLRVND